MTSLVARGLALATRLHPTDLVISGPSLVALVGPNGGGKTSLLRSIARVENAAGNVFVDGECVDGTPPARRRRLLSFMPASRDITWPIPVRDLLGLGADAEDPSRIEALLHTLELDLLADRPVNQLSTGERARVLMARAMASHPKLILLDEPLSNLDPYWVIRFLEIFRQAVHAGKILIVSVHDLSQLRHFDRAILVADGAVQLDKAPAELLSDERFESIFRITLAGADEWTVKQPADQRSLR